MKNASSLKLNQILIPYNLTLELNNMNNFNPSATVIETITVLPTQNNRLASYICYFKSYLKGAFISIRNAHKTSIGEPSHDIESLIIILV